MSLYEEIKKLGVEMDHHESDLYVKSTPETIKLTAGKTRYFFRNQIDGTAWIDLPFQYDPFWEKIGKNRQ